MSLLTPALAVYASAAFVANIYMGICGFGSGIIMVLGWQIANMLGLVGTCSWIVNFVQNRPESVHRSRR
jgi:hypothetical protein